MSASPHAVDVHPWQRGLFEGGAPAFDPAFPGIRHADLADGAWVEHLAGWVSGHEALLEALWDATRWRHRRRRMYERVVDVPRLVASLPEDGPGHPIVAIVSLGAPRRFLLRPSRGGSSCAFDLGRGDLLVMGGICQRTWQHGVPKAAGAGLRISVQFRSGTPDPGV